jgi:hypothetical protein
MPEKHTVFPPREALILVTVISSPRDLEIARVLGWYRIPLKSAPKIINVDYIAFYQTGSFGKEDGCRINHFAEVRGHEMVSRIELFHDEPEHPRAHEEYYKVQLGPLETLPTPILADDWKRITFFYTTGDLLGAATRIHELVVRSEERTALWHSLRERAQQNDPSRGVEYDSPLLDPQMLIWLGDWIKLPGENDSKAPIG